MAPVLRLCRCPNSDALLVCPSRRGNCLMKPSRTQRAVALQLTRTIPSRQRYGHPRQCTRTRYRRQLTGWCWRDAQAFIKAFQLNGFLLAPLCSSKAKQRLVVLKTLAKMTKLTKKTSSSATSRPGSAGSGRSGHASPNPDKDKKPRPSSVRARYTVSPWPASPSHASRAPAPPLSSLPRSPVVCLWALRVL